jgi:hypothetical protein
MQPPHLHPSGDTQTPFTAQTDRHLIVLMWSLGLGGGLAAIFNHKAVGLIMDAVSIGCAIYLILSGNRINRINGILKLVLEMLVLGIVGGVNQANIQRRREGHMSGVLGIFTPITPSLGKTPGALPKYFIAFSPLSNSDVMHKK